MKKTTSISINNTLFHIEDDAFARLDSYLSSIRNHFHNNPEKEEILRDIEERIAEKFTESKAGVITLKEVESIIDSMGTVEQFDTTQEKQTGEEKVQGEKTGSARRLYRSTDDVVVAGVASGIAQYFAIDPVLVRAIFFISIFFGGLGLLIYVVLWFIVPEARSVSQKLAMRGDSTTLSNVSKIIAEKIESVNTPKNRSAFRRLLMLPLKIIQGVGRFIQKVIFPGIRIIIGSIFSLAGFAGIVAITIFLGMALFNLSADWVEPAFVQFLSGPLFYITLASFYIALLIPLIFIAFLGLRILLRKKTLTKAALISLFAIWFIGLVGSGITASRITIQAEDILRTHPDYVEQTVIVPVANFNKLAASDSVHINFIQSDIYSVALTGQTNAINLINATTTEDGVLTIDRKPFNRTCMIFCGSNRIEVTVKAPTLEYIRLDNSSSLNGEIRGTDLTINMQNSSYAELKLSVANLGFMGKNSSRIEVTGQASSSNISLLNSASFSGLNLQSDTVMVDASHSSRAEVAASKNLTVKANNSSLVDYIGHPTVEKTISNSARLRYADHDDMEIEDWPHQNY